MIIHISTTFSQIMKSSVSKRNSVTGSGQNSQGLQTFTALADDLDIDLRAELAVHKHL